MSKVLRDSRKYEVNVYLPSPFNQNKKTFKKTSFSSPTVTKDGFRKQVVDKILSADIITPDKVIQSMMTDKELKSKIQHILEEEFINLDRYINELNEKASELKILESQKNEKMENGYRYGLEKGIEEGLERGIAEGIKNGQSTGYEKGYEEGYIAGSEKKLREMDPIIENKISGFVKIAESLYRSRDEIYKKNEEFLLKLVFSISSKIIKKELLINREPLIQAMRDLVKRAQGSDSLSIYMSEEDHTNISDLNKDLNTYFNFTKNICVLKDATLPIGSCRVETEHIKMISNIDKQLQDIESILFKKE